MDVYWFLGAKSPKMDHLQEALEAAPGDARHMVYWATPEIMGGSGRVTAETAYEAAGCHAVGAAPVPYPRADTAVRAVECGGPVFEPFARKGIAVEQLSAADALAMVADAPE